MSLALYMDVNVRRAVSEALRKRGVDALTAQQDGTTTLDDSDLLDRATALQRVLFSQDADLLREATRRQRANHNFYGLIYAHQLNVTVRECIEDLELLAKVYEPQDVTNRVVYLPLR